MSFESRDYVPELPYGARSCAGLGHQDLARLAYRDEAEEGAAFVFVLVRVDAPRLVTPASAVRGARCAARCAVRGARWE